MQEQIETDEYQERLGQIEKKWADYQCELIARKETAESASLATLEEVEKKYLTQRNTFFTTIVEDEFSKKIDKLEILLDQMLNLKEKLKQKKVQAETEPKQKIELESKKIEQIKKTIKTITELRDAIEKFEIQ